MRCRLLFVFALVLPLLATSTLAATPAPPPGWNAAMRSQILTSAEKALDGYFFSERNPTIRAAVEAHRATLVAIDDPQSFARAVSKVLYAAAHDKHLHLSYSPDVLPVFKNGKPTPDEIADMAHGDRFMDYGYSSSARLPGNIGYLRLAFFPPMPGSKAMYDQAMALLSNTDGLIIDLRDNGGGSPAAVDYLLGYFFPKQVEVSGFLEKRDGKIVARRMFSAAKLGGAPYVNKPVYLLVNENTISGGEQFVYDLKSLHRAHLIGQTTAGGANPGGPVRLNDHFDIFIPKGTARNPYTGTNWEGVGVSPDIAIDPKRALLAAYKLALKSANDSFQPAVEDRAMALQDPAAALDMVLPQH